MNVKVKIRMITEDKAVPLCECPWDRVEDLRRAVSQWGVHDGKSTESEIVGQFVVENGEAFFELIVGDED